MMQRPYEKHPQEKDSGALQAKHAEETGKSEKQYAAEFRVCGYIAEPSYPIVRLVLASEGRDGLHFRGHVGLSVLKRDFKVIRNLPGATPPGFTQGSDALGKDVTWLQPGVCCTVAYSYETKQGLLAHPQFKGLTNARISPAANADKGQNAEAW